jgi:nicotinate-nucleotide adenylyltransferase
MIFFRRAAGNPSRVAVFPGSFNPPTGAHVALAHAALTRADEVLWVLPRVFPHKAYAGASFHNRVRLLCAATCPETRFSVASSEGGLFIEIARECQAAYGKDIELMFLCGRDAAERVADWDYGGAGVFAEMLQVFGLLVAARHGAYEAPDEFRHRIQRLDVTPDLDNVSASEVRRRIREGEDWEHLVPAETVGMVREIYSPR